MKFLTVLALAAIALANPIANPPQMDITLEERASDECAMKCKTNYTLCYNMCHGQQILNGAPCARLCNVRGCKVVSLRGPQARIASLESMIRDASRFPTCS